MSLDAVSEKLLGLARKNPTPEAVRAAGWRELRDTILAVGRALPKPAHVSDLLVPTILEEHGFDEGRTVSELLLSQGKKRQEVYQRRAAHRATQHLRQLLLDPVAALLHKPYGYKGPPFPVESWWNIEEALLTVAKSLDTALVQDWATGRSAEWMLRVLTLVNPHAGLAQALPFVREAVRRSGLVGPQGAALDAIEVFLREGNVASVRARLEEVTASAVVLGYATPRGYAAYAAATLVSVPGTPTRVRCADRVVLAVRDAATACAMRSEKYREVGNRLVFAEFATALRERVPQPLSITAYVRAERPA